jgi:hypothetical protein
MNRLFEIASALGQLYQTRAQTNLLKWQAEQDIHARQLELTPADGWPGKNAEQRDVARDQTFAEDAQLQEAVKKANDAHRALIELEARIQALEAERRAAEWSVRADLVDALRAARVQSNHRGDSVAAAFDDTAQQVLDKAAFTDIDF